MPLHSAVHVDNKFTLIVYSLVLSGVLLFVSLSFPRRCMIILLASQKKIYFVVHILFLVRHVEWHQITLTTYDLRFIMVAVILIYYAKRYLIYM